MVHTQLHTAHETSLSVAATLAARGWPKHFGTYLYRN